MSDSIIDDGGPVYPGQWVDFQPTTGEQVVREQWTGISLRDWFAGQALAGLMAEPVDVACSYTQYAEAAYQIAGAMIAARKGGRKVKPWKRFWFESNRFFDWVNGPEDWKRLINEYPDKTEEWILERAKVFGGATKPNYGLRREHQGPGTLKDFFEENGMEVPSE